MNGVQLKDFMEQQLVTKGRSVIVFANNQIPGPVVAEKSPNALIRKYLNAGVKIALLGSNPLAYNPDPNTGVVDTVDFTLPEKVFGIHFSTVNLVNGYYGSRPTREGKRWGLFGFWVTSSAIDPAEATTVLALDEYGKASA